MQLDVSGHHVDVSQALKSYVKTKFMRLERHFDIATHAHVILSVEKLDQKAEATLHVSGGNLFADAVHTDMYAAIGGQKPLSDSKLAAILSEQGIKVARRTVAKYRESMAIPSSSERKLLI